METVFLFFVLVGIYFAQFFGNLLFPETELIGEIVISIVGFYFGILILKICCMLGKNSSDG